MTSWVSLLGVDLELGERCVPTAASFALAEQVSFTAELVQIADVQTPWYQIGVPIAGEVNSETESPVQLWVIGSHTEGILDRGAAVEGIGRIGR